MKKHKALKITIIILVAILVIAGVFLIWASDYYHADAIAVSVFQQSSNIESRDSFIVISPDFPTETAFVFYPGAKVEYTAYLPILDKISGNCGIVCILVKMPLNMAIFHSNAAEKIIDEFPDIKHWYIGGHSMGGAMASSYASKNSEKVEGLILMGAYIYGDYPPEKSLTIYGTFNANLEKNIDYTENIVVIDGGNHAQFGNYGKQKGDPDATISAEEQQNITVESIHIFLNRQALID